MAFRLPTVTQVCAAAVSLAANVLLPFAVYRALMHAGTGSLVALSVSTLLPVLKIVWGWARMRSVDLLSCFVILEVSMAIALSFLFHNARLMLLKGPVQAAALGLLCLGSVAVKRPLGIWLSRIFAGKFARIGLSQLDTAEYAHADAWRRVTVLWGVACILDAAVRVVLVFTLSVDYCLMTSRVFQSAFFALLGLATLKAFRKPEAVQPGNASA